MKKTLLSLLWLMVMAIAALPAKAQEDIPFIYVLGLGNWQPPTTENAEYYDQYRLFETAPGSKIYEGTLNNGYSSRLYFRFITKLTEDLNVSPWNRNVICPTKTATGWREQAMETLGTSGIYGAPCDVEEQLFNEDAGTWRISDLQPEMPLFFRVDLNTKRIYVCEPSATVLVFVGEQEKPTWDTIGNYIGTNTYAYLPAGDKYFYVYQPSGDRSYRNTEDWETPYSDSLRYFSTLNRNGSYDLHLTGWPGGRLWYSFQFDNEPNGWLNLELDSPVKSPLPTLDKYYTVGDFSGWGHSADNTLTPAGNGIYTGTLPASVSDFKFCEQMSWDANYGWNNVYNYDKDGNLVLGIEPGGMNFSIFGHTGDVTLRLDINARTLTVIGNSVKPNGGSEGSLGSSLTVPEDGKYLWLNKKDDTMNPTSENIAYIAPYLEYLVRTSDDTYEGTFFLAPGTSFNFFSKLAFNPNGATMLCPSSNRTINDIQGEFYSSTTSKRYNEAPMWTTPNETYYNYQLTYHVSTGKLDIFIPSKANAGGNQIYLVGSPQGWDVSSDAMALRQVNATQYYGEFYMDAAPMFRFYRELGAWDQNSIGSQEYDSPVDVFVDGQSTFNAVNGKGSWSITNWQGGTMHILVDLGSYQVTFSPDPIYFTPGQVGNQAADIYCDGWEFYKDPNADNLVYIQAGVGDGRSVKLYTKKLPMANDEPETENSYALSILDTPVFDKFGIAKVRFEVIDEVTTTKKANHLIVPEGDKLGSVMVAVDLDNQLLYVDKMTSWFVTEDPEATVSYLSYSTFNAPTVNLYEGGVIDVPQGDHSLWFASPSRIEQNYIVSEDSVKFDANGVWMPDWSAPRRMLAFRNWKGGKVMVMSLATKAVDMSKVDKLRFYTNSAGYPAYPENGGYLMPDGNGCFTGNLDVTAPEGAPTYLDILLATSESGRSILITVPIGRLTGNGLKNPGNAITFKSGAEQRTIAYGGGYSFLFPTVLSGRIAVKVNLEANLIDFSLDESANVGNSYEVYLGEEALTAYSTPENKDIVEASNSEFQGTAEFNFGGADGSVIVPADGNTTIEPDEFGLWTGSYTTVSTPQNSNRRRVASAQSKWTINSDQPTALVFSLDEANKKLTVHSSAHNKAIFISAINTNARSVGASMANIETLKANAMKAGASGVYTGKFDIDLKTYPGALFLHRGISDKMKGYSPMDCLVTNNFMQVNFDQTPEVNGVANFTGYYNGEVLYMERTGKAYTMSVTYDSNKNLVTVGTMTVGVDEAVADEALLLVGGEGYLTATAQEAMTLTVYNIQGAVVAVETLAAGEPSTIALPAGLYVAAGRKVLVK